MKKILALASVLLLAAPLSFAQGPVETTTLSLTVGAEASITLAATPAFNSSTTFSTYTTATPYTYSIRTSKSGGTGSIAVSFTSDWSGSGGPSITSPPTTGDYLSFTSSVSGLPATATSGSTNVTALTTGYPVATFGANASAAGNTGNSVAWSLVNDPKYAQGSYSVTATFTISAA
jgi:hypothetical protein